MTISMNIDSIKLQCSRTIGDVVSTIQESGPFACALIYDGDRFLNIITDGDIRRGILAGLGVENTVNAILLIKKQSNRPEPIVANVHSSSFEIDALFQRYALRQLVLVDDKGNPVSVVDHLSIGRELTHVNRQFVAVIMAGGFGTRLRPLTLDTPKPMLPINGRPLLDILVRKLVNHGAKQIYITTHYLPEKIVNHFGNGDLFGVPIRYIHEDTPLGTGGALSRIERHEDNTLIINGDILTELDFSLFQAAHIRSNSALSVAATQYSFQVPFGVLSERNGRVVAIEEKPTYSFMVNSGIYFISPLVFDDLPGSDSYGMPDLVNRLIEHNMNIGCFPVFEQWLDIGRPGDYDLASKLYE